MEPHVWAGPVLGLLLATTAAAGAPARDPRSPGELRRLYEQHSVRLALRDTFRVLHRPEMVPAGEARDALRPREWVIGVARGGEAKAYPVSVMGMHELVNDAIAGHPIAVCW